MARDRLERLAGVRRLLTSSAEMLVKRKKCSFAIQNKNVDKRSRAALKIKDRIFIEQILAKTYQEVEEPISTVILMPEVEDLDNEKKERGTVIWSHLPSTKGR